MNRIRLRTVVAALTVLGMFIGSTAHAQRGVTLPNLTGKWMFSVLVTSGTGTPTVIFKQDGQKLTGSYESRTFGTVAFTGTTTEKELTFTFEAEILIGDLKGEKVTALFRGMAVTKDKLSGTVEMGKAGNGAFSATREID